MENLEIARRLEELADLLEIQGANPFRVRAYRNAVRTISGLTRPLAAMVSDGEDLTELPGIGNEMASHIEELLETGELELMDEVTRDVPRELATLTRLDGVGPKKAAKLWKELDVTNIDVLEAVAKEGRVQELEGFGKKSVEKILRSIEEDRRRGNRFLRADAVEFLRPMLRHMGDAPGVERMEVAGSHRRGLETVGDIDLLVRLADDADEDAGSRIMEHFTSCPAMDRVEMAGETRGSVVLRSGLPVDLRIVPSKSWGAALHYFTGSKEHNVEVRKRGQRRGLRISEYGVFRAEDDAGGGDAEEGADDDDPRRGEWVAGAEEDEVFEAVGLPWIPPELRENRGELEAAERGELPRLVELDDIRGDLHMHTTWSDGAESIEAMARGCRERAYEYMAVTDHSGAVTVAGGLGPERIREQWDEIERVREKVEGIRILRGCEVDILKDGSLDLPDDVLEGLDIVLVAVHSHFDLDGEAMTRRVLTAISHPLVDLLVHPTGRLINRREPYAVDVEAVLEAALEHDVAVELNTNPRRLDLNDRHLYRARELGVPVMANTDAHRTAQLAHLETGLVQARRGWLEADDLLNTRSWEQFSAWLRRREE